MEKKASYPEVCLGVAPLCACKHSIEHKKGKKNSKHSDKLKKRRGIYVSVLLFSCGLYQGGGHNADAKKIADISNMYVEIPAYGINIVENSKARNEAYKTKRAIEQLMNLTPQRVNVITENGEKDFDLNGDGIND